MMMMIAKDDCYPYSLLLYYHHYQRYYEVNFFMFLLNKFQDYESRADMMIQQMNEQMMQLQSMAMSRIEV